jgi:hypothetical protein
MISRNLEAVKVLIKYKIIKVSSIKVEDVVVKALGSPRRGTLHADEELEEVSVYYQLFLYLM